jgi:hypothetical protein
MPPRLVEFDFDPKVIDAVTGNTRVTFTLQVADASEVKSIELYVSGVGSLQENDFALISGDSLDGTYQGTLIPEWLPNGAAWIHVLLVDRAATANVAYYNHRDLEAAGFPSQLVIWHGVDKILSIASMQNLLYLGVENRLRILDVTDPLLPVALGEVQTNGLVRDIALKEHFAYVANGNAGLSIVNARDPINPYLAGSIELSTGAEARYVSVTHDDRAFVSANGVYAVDVSDPTVPVVMEESFAGNSPSPIGISETTLLVGEGQFNEHYTLVFDLTVRDSLSEVGVIDSYLDGNVVSWGGLAYLATSDTLRVFDLSDPRQPVEIGSVYSSWGYLVEADAGLAVTAGANGDVWVYDVSIPSSLSKLGSVPWVNRPTNPSDIALRGSTLYVASFERGLLVYSLVDPANPVQISAYVPVIIHDSADLPNGNTLFSNYPNPFGWFTSIPFNLPQAADVTLAVYDVLGHQIRQLVSGTKPAGTYEVSFDATGLPSGVYFYRLRAGDFVETKRMVVVR